VDEEDDKSKLVVHPDRRRHAVQRESASSVYLDYTWKAETIAGGTTNTIT